MNKISGMIKVWKCEVDHYDEDECGEYPVYGPYKLIDIDYDDLCDDLGFYSDIHFIEVTRGGRITFSIGKPHEISALRRACEKGGYVPAKGLYDAIGVPKPLRFTV